MEMTGVVICVIMPETCYCRIPCCLLRCSHVDINCMNHNESVNEALFVWEAKALNKRRS